MEGVRMYQGLLYRQRPKLVLKVAFFCRLHQKPKKLKKMSTLKRKNLSISVQRSENFKYIFCSEFRFGHPMWQKNIEMPEHKRCVERRD